MNIYNVKPFQVLCDAHNSQEKAKYKEYMKTQSACEKVSVSFNNLQNFQMFNKSFNSCGKFKTIKWLKIWKLDKYFCQSLLLREIEILFWSMNIKDLHKWAGVHI